MGGKGSGRQPKYVMRSIAQAQEQALHIILDAFNDINCPIELKRQYALAIMLKGMTNKQEIGMTMIPRQEQLILDKYIDSNGMGSSQVEDMGVKRLIAPES